MQVRCPHCQGIFSTERAGVQFCPNCGQQINVPGAAAPGAPEAPAGAAPPAATPGPGPGGAPGQTGTPESMGPGGREPTPWERRAELGAFGGLWETWKKSMFSPEPFFSSVRPDSSWVDAMLYGWVVSIVSSVLRVPSQYLEMWGRSSTASTENLPAELQKYLSWIQASSGRTSTIVGSVVIGALLYPVMLLIGAAILHLCCMMWGCAKNGFWTTVRAVAYSQSPQVLVLIPCAGGLFAVVYTIVLEIFALGKMHDSTMGRAAGAVLTLVVVGCCCVCGGIALIAGMAGAAAAAAQH